MDDPRGRTLTPSPEPVVVEALLALDQATEHPFTATVDGRRLVFQYDDPAAGPSGHSIRFTYWVTLLPKTNEFTRVASTVKSGTNGSYRYSSTWVTTPVHQTLAAHGWFPRRSAIGRFLGRLVGARH